MVSVAPAHAAVLNSWKEIAAYLCRAVRTAQRWERDLGLPVHRPRGKDRSAVIALPSEIDSWLHSTPFHELKQAAAIAGTCLLHTQLHENLERCALLRRDLATQRHQQMEAVSKLISTLHAAGASVQAGAKPH